MDCVLDLAKPAERWFMGRSVEQNLIDVAFGALQASDELASARTTKVGNVAGLQVNCAGGIKLSHGPAVVE
jgi:hypothetical protein